MLYESGNTAPSAAADTNTNTDGKHDDVYGACVRADFYAWCVCLYYDCDREISGSYDANCDA